MQEPLVQGVSNEEFLKVVIAVITVYGGTLLAGVYGIMSWGIKRILEYHDMRRDIEDLKTKSDKLERDISAAHQKIRAK